ncbi:MAG TPA: MFS transporter [Candidatus Lokiarchaeia archaeon]|nr:MFS transporter [Candidatus Lokiarchaeia archaeon]
MLGHDDEKADPVINEEVEATKSVGDAPRDDSARRKFTMRLSMFEGSSSQTSFSISDNYLQSALALAMGCSDFQIGLLSGIAGLLDPTGQVIGGRLVERIRRKKLLTWGVLPMTLMWPVYILLIFFRASGVGAIFLSWLFVLAFAVYKLVGGIPSPAWFSMMGDVVPAMVRGHYFALRNLVVTGVSMTMIIITGFYLQWTSAQNMVLIGFAWVMVIGLCGRSMSMASFTKHYDPPFTFHRESRVTFWQFLRNLPGTNFGKFTIMVVIMNFGQYLSSPFFSVYMLQVLQFNYEIFIVVNMASSLVSLFVYPLLGRISDKIGNVRLLRIGAIIVPFLPLMWLFITNPIVLIIFPQLWGGVGWTAFNLGANNFILDSVESEKRAEFVSYYNFLNGVTIVLGGLFGGVFFIFPVGGSIVITFFTVFLVSSAVRGAVTITLIPRVKEVRNRHRD